MTPEERAVVAQNRRENRASEELDRKMAQALEDELAAVHASFALVLFQEGREAEAFEAVNRARKLRPTEPWVIGMLGETLLTHGHYAEAAKWYTTGLVRYMGALADIGLDDLQHDARTADLARNRYQARQSLGLAPDHLDELIELHGAKLPEPKNPAQERGRGQRRR